MYDGYFHECGLYFYMRVDKFSSLQLQGNQFQNEFVFCMDGGAVVWLELMSGLFGRFYLPHMSEREKLFWMINISGL